ncbi:MAG: GNAT family protein [Bacteroidales bacterium]|nr:GNAT family protein [Bacteroidales bacterium]MDZ4203449.1 GNAT family protein [Bacteroidales bacterium]
MQRPTLETKRLILRPLFATDGPRVQQLAGDHKVAATTLNIPHPYQDGFAEEWIASHESEFVEQKTLVLAICLKNCNELIGAISLTLKTEHQLAELGYWIGVPYWNRGYCTEACREIMRYGFTTLHLNKIFATSFAGNESSERVMQKLGMQQEARLRGHFRHWNQYQDVIGYGILKDDFLTNLVV